MKLETLLRLLRVLLDEASDTDVAHVGYVVLDVLANRVHASRMKLSGYNELFILRERLKEFLNKP